MFRLTARFEMPLQAQLLFKRPRTDELRFGTKFDGFDVDLYLNPDVQSYRRLPDTSEISNEDHYWSTSKVKIYVSRDEDEIPPILLDSEAKSNSRYFMERRQAYIYAACEVFNRTILFFKYILHIPNLLNIHNPNLFHPVWLDENGAKINSAGIIGIPISLPSAERFSVKPLSRSHDIDLLNALNNPISPDLTEQLLSDAQTAIFQDNLRRAVIEIAIACETTAKQYLEDHGEIHKVTVKDYIDRVAKQAFGKSFKEDNRSHYDNIDFIFRCRNKAAHRGELTYRDDSGVMHSVNKDTLAGWWDSAIALIDWLNANKSP